MNKYKVFPIFLVFSMLFSFLFIANQAKPSQPEGTNHIFLDWTEMISSRKSAIGMLPSYADFPENTTSWADYAEKSIEDLLTYDESWFIEPSTSVKGFRPYVKGADGWGGPDWVREISELMANLDVLWPFYRYLQLHPNNSRQTFVDDFIQELPKYYWNTYNQSTNRPYETTHDSWYYMENSVLKWGHLYMISNVSELRDPYFGSLQSGIDMAENMDYLFPQFVSVSSKIAIGNNNINYATGGLLAYTLINAYELTGNTAYLTIAETALTTLIDITQPYLLLYEPQELSAGVAAAVKMIQYASLINSLTDFSEIAIKLFYAEELALYYNNGHTDWNFGFKASASPWLPSNWRDGMHSPYTNPKELGNGGIDAPAYKENFEAVLFWVDLLKGLYGDENFNATEPLKILNLNRIKNFYFFSPNIPDTYERFYGPLTLQYIPYEDIDYHQTRGDKTNPADIDPLKAGYNGKEIYGAGETLWAYLMFEALGEAEDNKSMILNLNIFDKNYPSPTSERAFIVFNPYSTQKNLNFTLKNLTESYSLYADGTHIGDFSPGESFSITLSGGGSAYITLDTDTIPSSVSTTSSGVPTTSTSVPSTTNDPSTTSTSGTATTNGISLFFFVMAIFSIMVFRKRKID